MDRIHLHQNTKISKPFKNLDRKKHLNLDFVRIPRIKNRISIKIRQSIRLPTVVASVISLYPKVTKPYHN